MRDFSQIMCVIDPTSEEQPALERAARVAASAGASLELFICYYNEYLSGERLFDSTSLERARQEVVNGMEKYLETLAGRLRESELEVSVRAVWGHPLDECIVRHAAAINADLVFKDTHRHSAVSRALLTNTDWALIRNCASPLWLVQPKELPEHPVLVAAVDPLNEHDKPAALDDEILVIAGSLARRLGGELRAFHAYDPRLAVSSATANAYLPAALAADDIEKRMRTEHERRFEEVIGYHDIDRDHAHLVAGQAHEELPKLARELDASLVVMGAVSRNPLKRLFIGATAEKTLGMLPCDLLVVKPDWFQSQQGS